MGHNITAIVITGELNVEVAKALDLVAVPLSSALTLFHIDHYYSAYWQAVRRCTEQLDVPPAFPGVFPREGIIVRLVAKLTGLADPRFALIQTEYFGGAGGQWACAFTGGRRETSGTTNEALRTLGVVRQRDMDEFDTVELRTHRRSPAYLERYVHLCDELGV